MAELRRGGYQELLIADALECREERGRFLEAVPQCTLMVCRLRASLATMQERVRRREPGMLQERYLARVAELEALLDAARAEDFEVHNDGRPATEVAPRGSGAVRGGPGRSSTERVGCDPYLAPQRLAILDAARVLEHARDSAPLTARQVEQQQAG